MIFFYNAQGNAINVVPEVVYQGSNKANTIYVVAPFPNNVQVLAHFLLPNGKILQPVYAPNKNGLTLLDTLNINNSSVGVWGVQLTKVMTAYAGTVSVQFEFISYDQAITTKTVTFPVSKGVPPAEPIDLTLETTLQEILSYVSTLLPLIDDNVNKTNDSFVLYGTGQGGVQANIPYSTTSLGKTIPRRNAQGGLSATTTENGEADDLINRDFFEKELLKYQKKTDEALNTESKEIVGAINELKENIDNLPESSGTAGLAFTITSEEEKTCSVNKGVSSDKTVIIPPYAYIDGKMYTVASVEEKGFFYATTRKTIVLPETITKIGQLAFNSCTYLTHINIPNNVVEIGSLAFAYCRNLEEIVIPDSVTTITPYNDYPRALFKECTNLKRVVLGKGITKLPYQCFLNCTSLTDIIIKGKITTVYNGAFNGVENATIWVDDSLVDYYKTLLSKYTSNPVKSYRDIIGINEYINDISSGESSTSQLFYHRFRFNVYHTSSKYGDQGLFAHCTCLLLSSSATKIDNATEFLKYANQNVIWLFHHETNEMWFGRFMTIYGGELVLFDGMSANNQYAASLPIVGEEKTEFVTNTFSIEFDFDYVTPIK